MIVNLILFLHIRTQYTFIQVLQKKKLNSRDNDFNYMYVTVKRVFYNYIT